MGGPRAGPNVVDEQMLDRSYIAKFSLLVPADLNNANTRGSRRPPPTFHPLKIVALCSCGPSYNVKSMLPTKL